MKSFDIEDYQITASRILYYDPYSLPPWNARLDSPKIKDGVRNGLQYAWFRYGSVPNTFVQVDLMAVHRVTGFAFQGHPTYNSYVTKFKIQYSNSSLDDMQWYSNDNGAVLVSYG
jgi:hypothetical protein